MVGVERVEYDLMEEAPELVYMSSGEEKGAGDVVDMAPIVLAMETAEAGGERTASLVIILMISSTE